MPEKGRFCTRLCGKDTIGLIWSRMPSSMLGGATLLATDPSVDRRVEFSLEPLTLRKVGIDLIEPLP